MDDYWNATSGSSFRFDDEIDMLQESEGLEEESDEIFNSMLYNSNTLPVQLIISKRTLEYVLDDTLIGKPLTVSPIEETIDAMYHGDSGSHTMLCHRTLDDKIRLLDKAIETFDGNIILKIVLYLSKNLRPNIFYKHLNKRPIALRQYSDYLLRSNRFKELEDLFLATESSNQMSKMFYRSTKDKLINAVQKKLNQFPANSLQDDYEKSLFNLHARFIEYKIDKNLVSATPITVMVEIINKNIDNYNITDYIKLMKITDVQHDWILLNMLAASSDTKSWNKITEKFLRPVGNWYLHKNTIKTNINIELIILALHRHDAPQSVLNDFLTGMNDTDGSLYLGKKFKCHQYVIDTLKTKRDRLGLISYKSYVPSQSDFFATIDRLLQSNEKWNN